MMIMVVVVVVVIVVTRVAQYEQQQHSVATPYRGDAAAPNVAGGGWRRAGGSGSGAHAQSVPRRARLSTEATDDINVSSDETQAHASPCPPRAR